MTIAPPTAGIWDPERRRLSAGLILAIVLVASETLAVSTVLPKVREDLGGIALYGWVFSLFFLTQIIGITLSGAVSDRRGAALPLGTGLALFAVGLTIGALAPSMLILVVGRGIQGLGSGGAAAIPFASVGRGYPEQLRPRMLAVLSTAWVVPGLVGPAAASAVAEHATWRLVFAGLIPLVPLAAGLALPALRALDRRERAEADRADRAEDEPDPGSQRTHVLRAVRLALGAAIVLQGLDQRSVPIAVALVVVGLVLAIPALKALTPPGTLAAVRGMPAAVATRGLLNVGFFAGDAFLPLALHNVRHQRTIVAGIVLTISTTGWTVGTWIQAQTIGRRGPRTIATIGLSLVTIGLLLLLVVLSPGVPVWVAMVAWPIAAVGIGLTNQTQTLVVLDEAAPGTQGSATASLQLVDVLGIAVGTGIAGAAVAAADHAGWTPRTGLTIAFVVAAAVASFGAVTAHRLPTARRVVT